MAWWQTIDRQTDGAKPAFPQEFELIPGKLRSTVYLKPADTQAGTPSQWIYTSTGLWQQGQKEIYFALHKEEGNNPLEFPQAPLQFFKTVYEHAEKEQYVDFGSITEFSCSGFLHETWKAMAYLEPLPGEQSYFQVPAVSAILLNDIELRVASQFGLTRVMTLLGKHFNYYPCPRWSYLQRSGPLQESSLNCMKAARTADIPRLLLLESAIYRYQDITVLEIPQSSGSKLKALLQRPSAEPIMFITSYDLAANICLVWQDEPQNGPCAIAAPGSTEANTTGANNTRANSTGTNNTTANNTSSRLTANSLSLVMQENGKSVSTIEEDGFLIGIDKNNWYELRQALIANSDFNLYSADGKLLFQLKWSHFNRYRSSSKNLNHNNQDLACGQTYVPPAAESIGEAGISLQALNLLNNEAELKERINAEAVASYLRQCYQVVEQILQPDNSLPTGTLKIRFCFSKETKPALDLHNISLSQALPDSQMQILKKGLEDLEGPVTREGEIIFEMLVSMAPVT